MLSQRLDAEIEQLAGKIYDAAGKTFNINSPQQLGKVLFEDLRLPVSRQIRQGQSHLDRRGCPRGPRAEVPDRCSLCSITASLPS